MSSNRALIVDDDPRICTLLKRVAESQGYEAFAIANPDLFEDSYYGFEPSLILMDLQMNGQDGIQLLKFLAREHAGAPIVLMSGVKHDIIDSARMFATSVDLNIDTTFSKPFQPAELSEVLNRYYKAPRANEESTVKLDKPAITDALENHRFCMYYEPVVRFLDNEVCAIETMMRWRNSVNNDVSPEFVLDRGDDIDVTKKLTRFKIETTLLECSDILERENDMRLSISLFDAMFFDYETPDFIENLLGDYGIRNHRLTLNIVKSTVLEDYSAAMEIMSRLRLKGFRLCLDDFDRRSINLITDSWLPFTELKLSKRYIANLAKCEDNPAKLESLLKWSTKLGLTVYAKKLDSPETYKMLSDSGILAGQGDFICRPLCANGFSAWVDEKKQVC